MVHTYSEKGKLGIIIQHFARQKSPDTKSHRLQLYFYKRLTISKTIEMQIRAVNVSRGREVGDRIQNRGEWHTTGV